MVGVCDGCVWCVCDGCVCVIDVCAMGGCVMGACVWWDVCGVWWWIWWWVCNGCGVKGCVWWVWCVFVCVCGGPVKRTGQQLVNNNNN
jgi:hypothetical protein